MKAKTLNRIHIAPQLSKNDIPKDVEVEVIGTPTSDGYVCVRYGGCNYMVKKNEICISKENESE